MDAFVIYDNIQYTKKGWINRNRILQNGVDKYISLPIEKDSEFLDVKERLLADDFDRKCFVRKFGGFFHTWYIYGQEWKTFHQVEAPDRVYKIGHAVSDDGVEWRKEGRQIIEDRIEAESLVLSTVVRYNGKYHMFFDGGIHMISVQIVDAAIV